jgi:hypothetical protein
VDDDDPLRAHSCSQFCSQGGSVQSSATASFLPSAEEPTAVSHISCALNRTEVPASRRPTLLRARSLRRFSSLARQPMGFTWTVCRHLVHRGLSVTAASNVSRDTRWKPLTRAGQHKLRPCRRQSSRSGPYTSQIAVCGQRAAQVTVADLSVSGPRSGCAVFSRAGKSKTP